MQNGGVRSSRSAGYLPAGVLASGLPRDKHVGLPAHAEGTVARDTVLDGPGELLLRGADVQLAGVAVFGSFEEDTRDVPC
jgi:hypothetical protein